MKVSSAKTWFDCGRSAADQTTRIPTAIARSAAGPNSQALDSATAAAVVLALFTERERQYLIRFYLLGHKPSAIECDLQLSAPEAREIRSRAKSIMQGLMTDCPMSASKCPPLSWPRTA
jgi:hypothetical protein